MLANIGMLNLFKELIKNIFLCIYFSRWAIVTFGILLGSLVANCCLIRKWIRGAKNSRILVKHVASLEQQMKTKNEPASPLPRFSYRPAPLPPAPALNSMGSKMTLPSPPRGPPLDGASASFPDDISSPATKETEDTKSEDTKI